MTISRRGVFSFLAGGAVAGAFADKAAAQDNYPAPQGSPYIYQKRMGEDTRLLNTNPQIVQVIEEGKSFAYEKYPLFKNDNSINDPLAAQVIRAVEMEWAADDARKQGDKEAYDSLNIQAINGFYSIGSQLQEMRQSQQHTANRDDRIDPITGRRNYELIEIGKAHVYATYESYFRQGYGNSLGSAFNLSSVQNRLIHKAYPKGFGDYGFSAGHQIAQNQSRVHADDRDGPKVISAILAQANADEATRAKDFTKAGMYQEQANNHYLVLGQKLADNQIRNRESTMDNLIRGLRRSKKYPFNNDRDGRGVIGRALKF